MNKNITLLKGDGIGPEIVCQAVKVLDAVAKKYGHKFNYTEVDIGGCSIDKFGVPITDEGMEKCKRADAVLLGAVGGIALTRLSDPKRRFWRSDASLDSLQISARPGFSPSLLIPLRSSRASSVTELIL